MVARAPFISVVIPVHNRVSTIQRSLSSVLNQSYEDFELLIIDDHSSDGSAEIAKSIGDARVAVHVLDENHGAAFCRNYGASLAKGTYVAFQDSDDAWHEDKLAKQVDAIKRFLPDLCISRFERHGYGRGVAPIVPGDGVHEGWVTLKNLVRGDLVGMPTVVVNREKFLVDQFDPTLRWCEDYEWSIRFGKNNTVYLLDDVLVDVYLQDDSVTVTNGDGQAALLEKIVGEHDDLLRRYPWFYADVLGSYAKCLIQDGEEASRYYLRAFQVAHRPKDMLKYVLASVGLIRLFFRRS